MTERTYTLAQLFFFIVFVAQDYLPTHAAVAAVVCMYALFAWAMKHRWFHRWESRATSWQ